MRATSAPTAPALNAESSLLVLTNRRLCHRSAEGTWSEFPIDDDLELTRAERGGVGELRVVRAGHPVISWSHTLAQARTATDLYEAFVSLRASASARGQRRSIPEADEWAPTGAFRGSVLSDLEQRIRHFHQVLDQEMLPA